MKNIIRLALILVIFVLVLFLAVVISRIAQDPTDMNAIQNSANDLLPTAVSEERLNILEGVFFEQAEYDHASSAIIFTLHNKTSDTIYYGDETILEKNIDGQWHVIPYSGEIGFTSILNYLLPLEETQISVPMSVWIKVTAGEYRVIKEVSPQEYYRILYPISADFMIEK